MRISHPVWLGIAGAVIASASCLFAISAGASTSVVTCPVTRWDLPARGTNSSQIATGTSGHLEVTVLPSVFITVESGVLRVSTNTGHRPVITDRFYLIRRGWAGHAPVRVVERVLRSCR